MKFLLKVPEMKYFFLNNGRDLEEKNLLINTSLVKNYFSTSLSHLPFHASYRCSADNYLDNLKLILGKLR